MIIDPLIVINILLILYIIWLSIVGDSRQDKRIFIPAVTYQLRIIWKSYAYWETVWITAFIENDIEKQIESDCEIIIRIEAICHIMGNFFSRKVAINKMEELKYIWINSKNYVAYISTFSKQNQKLKDILCCSVKRFCTFSNPSPDYKNISNLMFNTYKEKYIDRYEIRIKRIKDGKNGSNSIHDSEDINNILLYSQYMADLLLLRD